MDIEEDIKILNEYINIDRKMRNNSQESDYDKFCERQCIAIERILAEREANKKKIEELEEHQEKFYNGELYTAKQLKQIEENQKKYFINKQKVKDYLEEEKERFEVYKKESETNETLKLGMYRHLGAKKMCEKILGIEKNIATLD